MVGAVTLKIGSASPAMVELVFATPIPMEVFHSPALACAFVAKKTTKTVHSKCVFNARAIVILPLIGLVR